MSWQAVESVQDNSTITDHTALSIFYVIARHADGNGIVGANGRLTSPSIDTIARLARCHRNTVLNWLPKIEETGELIIERFGSGRGSWNRYTINLPMPAGEGDNSTTKDVPLKKEMVQVMVQETVQALVPIIAEMVQVMVHNGTTQGVPDTNNTDLRNIYIPPDPEPIAEIKTALAKISKTVQDPETAEDYDRAAYEILGWDSNAGQVLEFGEWWKINGHYQGLPALKSIRNEYRNFLSGVVTPHLNGNGSSPSKSDIAETIVNAVARHGRSRGKQAKEELAQHWHIIGGMGGWGTVCGMKSDDIKFGVYGQLKGAKA